MILTNKVRLKNGSLIFAIGEFTGENTTDVLLELSTFIFEFLFLICSPFILIS